jgi:hypothetical protein
VDADAGHCQILRLWAAPKLIVDPNATFAAANVPLVVEHGVQTIGSNPLYECYLSSTGSLTIKGGLEEVSGDTLGLRASDFIDISG